MTVKAARARFSPADIARVRSEMDALEAEPWDAEATEATEADSETTGLLARARRVVARSPADTAPSQAAIATLEAAIDTGDAAAIDEHAEALLDVLYDMDDEGDEA